VGCFISRRPISAAALVVNSISLFSHRRIAFRTGAVIGGSLCLVDSFQSFTMADVDFCRGIVGDSFRGGKRSSPRAGPVAGNPGRAPGVNQVRYGVPAGRIRHSRRPRRVFSRLNTTGRAGSKGPSPHRVRNRSNDAAAPIEANDTVSP